MKKIFTLVLAASAAVVAQAEDAAKTSFALDVTPANGEVEVVNSIRISSAAKTVFGVNPNSTKSITLSLEGETQPVMFWNAQAIQNAVVVEENATATVVELTADNVTPDPADPDFGGNASGEDDQFGVEGDNQDPDFGGNASGEDDQFTTEGEDPTDPDFGGNASGDDDQFGVEGDNQDPDFGGNASGDDDQFTTDGEDPTTDPDFGGNDSEGDNQFGVDGPDEEFGGNDSEGDNYGVDSEEQDPTYGGNDSEGDTGFGAEGEDPDSSFGGFGGDDAFGIQPIIGKTGKYTLVIPAGIFTADEAENDETTIEWTATVAGITDIKVNGVAIKGIYDLRGNRVNNPSHGIYIINGIKTLVK